MNVEALILEAIEDAVTDMIGKQDFFPLEQVNRSFAQVIGMTVRDPDKFRTLDVSQLLGGYFMRAGPATEVGGPGDPRVGR